jgi:hypothetical protein
MLLSASISPVQSPSSLSISNESGKPRRTRQYQSTLEELFPIQIPSSAKKRKRVVDSESDSDNLDQIQLEPSPPSVSESEAQPPSNNDDDDDDSDDIIGPSHRRRRLLPSSPPQTIQSPRTPSPRHPSLITQDSEDSELSQEVRDITSSARKARVAQRMRDPQSRNKLKSQFQKSLESLRKKKQGLPNPDSEQEDDDTDDDDDDDESRDPRRGGGGLYDSDSDVDSVGSEDFVVNDEMEIPLEQLMEIPPEFTSVSYQGPQLNFKVVVQGEVYALLHPDYHGMDYTSMIYPIPQVGWFTNLWVILILWIRISGSRINLWNDRSLGLRTLQLLVIPGDHGL